VIRQVSDSEMRYPTTQKEALAIFYKVSQFKPQLVGRQFTVVTDHKALVWLWEHRNTHAMLGRWALKLHGMSIIIKARPAWRTRMQIAHHAARDQTVSRRMATRRTCRRSLMMDTDAHLMQVEAVSIVLPTDIVLASGKKLRRCKQTSVTETRALEKLEVEVTAFRAGDHHQPASSSRTVRKEKRKRTHVSRVDARVLEEALKAPWAKIAAQARTWK
jgi:hypothetical protein